MEVDVRPDAARGDESSCRSSIRWFTIEFNVDDRPRRPVGLLGEDAECAERADAAESFRKSRGRELPCGEGSLLVD